MPKNHAINPSKQNTLTTSVNPKPQLSHTDIKTVENNLIEICLKIGSIAGKNSQFTHGLALRISKIKTPICELNIAEFVNEIDAHTLSFNSVFGGES